ncbi:hypothetical protein NEAUS06_0957 [Nematocida ausubeli]|nr:hypothetical protein NEAUS06_0957 [Nematocida ausubeli]
MGNDQCIQEVLDYIQISIALVVVFLRAAGQARAQHANITRNKMPLGAYTPPDQEEESRRVKVDLKKEEKEVWPSTAKASDVPSIMHMASGAQTGNMEEANLQNDVSDNCCCGKGHPDGIRPNNCCCIGKSPEAAQIKKDAKKEKLMKAVYSAMDRHRKEMDRLAEKKHEKKIAEEANKAEHVKVMNICLEESISADMYRKKYTEICAIQKTIKEYYKVNDRCLPHASCPKYECENKVLKALSAEKEALIVDNRRACGIAEAQAKKMQVACSHQSNSRHHKLAFIEETVKWQRDYTNLVESDLEVVKCMHKLEKLSYSVRKKEAMYVKKEDVIQLNEILGLQEICVQLIKESIYLLSSVYEYNKMCLPRTENIRRTYLQYDAAAAAYEAQQIVVESALMALNRAELELEKHALNNAAQLRQNNGQSCSFYKFYLRYS